MLATERETKMDLIDEIIASGGVDSPRLVELSVSERRRMHARIEGCRPMGERLGGKLTGHEARRQADEDRQARARDIGAEWRRDGNRGQ